MAELIDEHEVISFDIFDTLLLRPFIKPADVFYYVEYYTKNSGFRDLRIKAEKSAREKSRPKEDITFDEIYNEMPDGAGSLKQCELELEMQTLVQNYEMRQVYEYAKKSCKKIIITSDMYLPEDILEKVLNKNGYGGWDKLYVSSETGKTKHYGSLYGHIIKELGTENILHIGDNKHADVDMAQEKGITACWYKPLKQRFFEQNRRFEKYYNYNKDNITASIILGLSMLKRHNSSADRGYYYNLGYELGGPVVLAFTQTIIEIANTRGLSDLLFVSRDGYALNKAYEIINTCSRTPCGAKNHYVYANRKLAYRYCHWPETRQMPFLKIHYPELSFCNIFEVKKFYAGNIEEINKKIDDNRQEYADYINSLGLKGSNIGLADSIAGGFSVQTLIESFIKDKNIYGIYLKVLDRYNNDCRCKYDYICLMNSLDLEKEKYNWNLIELLLSGEEPPVTCMKNNKPVFEAPDFCEQERIRVYKDIFQGEMDFVKDYLNVFGNFNLRLQIPYIFEYIEAFWETLDDADKEELGKIKHNIDGVGIVYKSLTGAAV